MGLQPVTSGPLTNIVIAPAETGAGVPVAAGGRHFLGNASLGGVVAKGHAHRRLGRPPRSACESVEIRSACGGLRTLADVDQEVAHKAERAVARATSCSLHVLDASKNRSARRQLRVRRTESIARYPGRVLAVVDACQLRCSAAAVRQALASGMAVMITGSKVAGGPAFCGALLLPAGLCDHLASACALSGAALAPYSAVLDWPRSLRLRLHGGLVRPQRGQSRPRLCAGPRPWPEIDAFERVPAACGRRHAGWISIGRCASAPRTSRGRRNWSLLDPIFGPSAAANADALSSTRGRALTRALA